MDKQTLTRSLTIHVEGASFINGCQLAKYLKMSRNAIPDLLQGLEYIESGRSRKYFIPDVAGRLMEVRK